MQREYALLSAQVDLYKRDPSLSLSPGEFVDAERSIPRLTSVHVEFLLPAESIVLRLAQANEFDLAMAASRSLKVDMTDLFSHLTIQCLRLSRNTDAVLYATSDSINSSILTYLFRQETSSSWLLTDKVSSWPGTPSDRAWRYLRQSLERHDSAETDYSYAKVVFETIMARQKSPPPPWLVQLLEVLVSFVLFLHGNMLIVL